MPHIKELRKEEMQEIIDFWYSIEEYGHIFYGDNSELEPAFKKIMRESKRSDKSKKNIGRIK